jgi:hypothetical protein
MNISGTFESTKKSRQYVFNFHFFNNEINFLETMYDHVIKNINMTVKLLKWKQKGIMNHIETCNYMTATAHISINKL